MAPPVARARWCSMTDVLAAFRDGLRRVARAPAFLAGLWLALVAAVVPPALLLRESLAMLLETCGAEVHTVSDGPAALVELDTYRPSVMLLDIGMPGMDGFEVARRARQRPDGRELTVIALSGWGQEEDRRRSRDAGIDYHLVKPVDVDELGRVLAALTPANSNRLRVN